MYMGRAALSCILRCEDVQGPSATQYARAGKHSEARDESCGSWLTRGRKHMVNGTSATLIAV